MTAGRLPTWRVTVPAAVSLVLLCSGSTPLRAQDAATDPSALAKASQNPVAAITTLPFQFNFNTGGDLEDATWFNVNIQPVIPFRLNERVNVISRTIVPISSLPGPDGTRYSGLGDIQEQVFLTPATPGAIVWGAGPVFSLPTATTLPFQTGTFAAGVGVVVVKTAGPFVVGGVVSQFWPVTDAGDRPETNLLTTQPFVNYNFGAGWALAFAPLITANWDAPSGEEWTVPLGIGLTRTTVFNRRPMTLGVQYYRNVVRPGGAAGNQIRLSISLLYPQAPPRP